MSRERGINNTVQLLHCFLDGLANSKILSFQTTVVFIQTAFNV